MATTTPHLGTPPTVSINYSIASATPHSGKYGPEHISVDRPQDQSSRWSGAFQGNTNQWIILRLESLAVLKTITFGKHSKPHPCNMKEFKVFVGTTEDHMTEVLHSGLKNDPVPETFSLKYVNTAGVVFPSRFVKIVPLLAHGQNFHVSIWHVAVNGFIEPGYVDRVLSAYDEFRETAVLQSILKHLRQRRLLTPYQSILSRANIYLEHPLVTQLHESIVLQGDWSKSEQLLQALGSNGLFESYSLSSPTQSQWTRLHGTDADGDLPTARGGHAMCMDPENEIIYIFGGWDGKKSLDDFWAYHVKEDKWKLLSPSTTQEQNAPGVRSCHKMVFDTKTGSIYVLGRLNDTDGLRAPARPHGAVAAVTSGHQTAQASTQTGASTGGAPAERTAEPPRNFSSEFYRYHTRGMLAGKWDFLSIDTAASGGPPLMFDHQMVMDSDEQMIYVLGGRILDGDWDVSKYSGLYSYNVSSSKWKLLHPRNDNSQSSQMISSRFGHSMVLDPNTKTLYIFAGKRDEKYLADMYSYHIPTDTVTEIFSNFTAAGGPEACFTQRAVIDPSLKEIYVFSGLSQPPSSSRNTLRNLADWVYRYETQPGKWMQINEQPDRLPSERPQPRFAHQVAYNPNTKSIFLHGGSTGQKEGDQTSSEVVNVESKDNTSPEKKMDDFWRMELKRPGSEEIIRQAKFHIRRQQFREMCEEVPPVKALNFLQTKVSSVVDHSDAKETEIFRSLLTHLLSPPPIPPTVKADSRPSTSSTSSSTASSLVHEDTRDNNPRPTKRSRPGKERSESGTWTNEFVMGDKESSSSSDEVKVAQHLREMTDPLEAIIRGKDAEPPLSGPRYAQRTEVFENILKFINECERQPQDSLLDLVEKDRCRTF